MAESPPREEVGVEAEEREEPAEEVKEKVREIDAEARKITDVLSEFAKRLGNVDVPRLVRSLLLLGTTGMTLYVVGVSLATMLPYAVPVFAQLGFILGYMVPLMFMATMLSIVVGLARTLIK